MTNLDKLLAEVNDWQIVALASSNKDCKPCLKLAQRYIPKLAEIVKVLSSSTLGSLESLAQVLEEPMTNEVFSNIANGIKRAEEIAGRG